MILSRSANPILDIRYWNLLDAIVVNLDHNASKGIQTRPVKTWLTPLLNRTPISPILLSFLAASHGVPSEDRCRLSITISQCMGVLWPLSAHKVGVEALLELWGTFLKAAVELGAHDDLDKLGETITTSFRSALSNCSNKKKVRSIFLFKYVYRCDLAMACNRSTKRSHRPTLSRGFSIFTASLSAQIQITYIRQAQRFSLRLTFSALCTPKTRSRPPLCPPCSHFSPLSQRLSYPYSLASCLRLYTQCSRIAAHSLPLAVMEARVL